jgi:3'(2'),5'-bisphosphate nucleotidase
MPLRDEPDLLLDALVEAALAGARAVMQVYATDFSVERKADDSPVSEADRLAEEAIVKRLVAAMPGVPVIAEEAAAEGRIPSPGREFLLVDPLDGTKEFVSRNGEFTVNIGLIRDGVPVAGIVLAPALGLAYAGTGGMARKGTLSAGCDSVIGWRPIRVRGCGANPVAVASRSHGNSATEAVLDAAGAGDCTSIGSSLKFCLVAEGAADFYPRLGPTMEWDTAAADAVLRAAGGAVVTRDGPPLRYGKSGVPGMRDFENPHFLAAGDIALLRRLAA